MSTGLESDGDLRELIIGLLAGDDSAEKWKARVEDPGYRARVVTSAQALAGKAFIRSPGERAAQRNAHWILNDIYDRCFGMPPIDQADFARAAILDDIRTVLENAMLDHIRSKMDTDPLADLPAEPDEFMAWYRHFISVHKASDHPFYRDFMEKRATLDDIQFYLAQETSLDPRFDDILALLIVGTDGSEKMELVGNLWDELGNGAHEDVHTTVFAKTLHDAGVSPEFIASNIMLESLICGNVSAALALSKGHYYKAIGYFGVTEYLTPRRFRSYVRGCQRLNLPEAAYRYHHLHIQIDAKHGPAWFKNILVPAVAREPRCAREIAEGTLLRMETSTRYLDALQARLESPGRARV